MRHAPEGGPRTHAAGFSMVELMAIVAIIGLMTVMTSVAVEAVLPGERLNTSIRVLASDLMSARTEASSRGMEYRLIYDLDEHRYRISTPFAVGEESRLRLERDEEYDDDLRYYTPWVELGDGVEFQAVHVAGLPHTRGEVYVRFDPLGTATDHSVVLTQPAFENSFTVEVLPLTGLIRMHDGVYLREPAQEGDFR